MNTEILKILVVEPDQEIAQLINTTLEAEVACEVTTVHTSQQAMSLCERENFDLVITEQYLPNGTGPTTGSELVSNIRNLCFLNSDIPVLFFTVYTDEIFALSTLPKEDIYVLDKTSRMEKLVTWAKILLYSQVKRKAKKVKELQKKEALQERPAAVLSFAR